MAVFRLAQAGTLRGLARILNAHEGSQRARGGWQAGRARMGTCRPTDRRGLGCHRECKRGTRQRARRRAPNPKAFAVAETVFKTAPLEKRARGKMKVTKPPNR